LGERKKGEAERQHGLSEVEIESRQCACDIREKASILEVAQHGEIDGHRECHQEAPTIAWGIVRHADHQAGHNVIEDHGYVEKAEEARVPPAIEKKGGGTQPDASEHLAVGA